MAIDGVFAGWISFSDILRSEARRIIDDIHDVGVKTLLLTGDGPRAANRVAQIAGIHDVQAGCLPQDKMDTITRLQKRGELLCMVGDGINDAPALKTAYVGIAMGGIGSDIAIDAADIVLVGDDIRGVPHLLELSHKTMKTIRLNLTLSMLLNFVAIVLAMAGILNTVVGALVHNAGSVAVIINSALILQWKK